MARCAVVIVAALTAASFGCNLATGPAPRPPGLRMLSAGGFDTRYRTWGTSGLPVVPVPGAFETADTFAALGAVLGTDHRVFAIDLTGTGYSTPSPPYTAGHLADQLPAFLAGQGLTGANAPRPGQALQRRRRRGHGGGARQPRRGRRRVPRRRRDAAGNPVRTGLAADPPVPDHDFAVRADSSWLIQRIYAAQCGPTCPPLTAAGVETWRRPLQQPGFESAVTYIMRHGIPSMTAAEFSQLRLAAVSKRVIFGINDPSFPRPELLRPRRASARPRRQPSPADT